MNSKENLTVIGVGRLGLCFALTLEKTGYNVVGVDVSPEYVTTLNTKTLTSPEPHVEEYLEKCTNFHATINLAKGVAHARVLYAVVATPSLPNGRYDHSQVDNLVSSLQALGAQEEEKHLVVCCTTMPGYTDIVAERLKDYNYKVSYNPEFIAQGTIIRDQARPDMVLIGEANEECGNELEEHYCQMTENSPTIARMSPLSAEITKLSLNCFCTTKIAFANMIGDIAIKAGGEPDKILAAVGSDSRVGNKCLRYGFGYGGPCFPRDNRALAIYASDINMPAKISLSTDEMNKHHLDFQTNHFVNTADKTKTYVFSNDNNYQLEDNEVSVGPITYKPGTNILEESQQKAFAFNIASSGFNVKVVDTLDVIDRLQGLNDSVELVMFDD
jgi:UDPglucose 6-dehydrogenase